MSCASSQIKSHVKGLSNCQANTILSGMSIHNTNEKERKYTNDVMEYCLDVAKGFVQRQAFYIVDLADILWKVQLWNSRLPNVEIFYAVKANDDATLLRLLALLGLSFDCASQAEIRMTLEAGAKPSNIIFAHTIKTEEELHFASEVGVDLMTFDNEEELYKIHRIFPNARLILRLAPSEVNCQLDLSKKFGCGMEDVEHLLETAKKLKLKVIGVSFHVGGLCADPRSYTSTIKESRSVFDKAAEMGFQFSILDIGAGFFGSTASEAIFYKISDAITQSLKEYFSGDDIRIIAEPGCYIAASAFSLVCTVLGKKTVKSEDQNELIRCYYLNDGIYGSFFRDILMFDIAVKPLLSPLDVEKRPKFFTKMYGQTCCSRDVLPFEGIFPDLNVGERVLWENMGAYSGSRASTFCSSLIPKNIPIFKRNKSRLDLEWISNKENVVKFIKENADFIGMKKEDFH